MSGRVSASERVLGVYEKYSANVRKEKKRADVQELLIRLFKEGVIEERYTRDNVVYSPSSEEARMNIEPAVDAGGVIINSGFVKEIESKVQEICQWAKAALMLRVSTKREPREDLNDKELAELGFQAGQIRLCENETAEAVLEAELPPPSSSTLE